MRSSTRRGIVALVAATVVSLALVVTTPAQPADAQLFNPCDLPGLTSTPLCIAVNVGGAGLDVAGDIISEEIAQLAAGTLTTVVSFFGNAALDFMEAILSWWITRPSLIDGRSELVQGIASNFYWLSTLLVTAGFLWGGIQTIVQRKTEPIADLARATLIYIFTAAGGLTLIQGFAAVTDAWAAQLITTAFDLPNLAEVFGGILLTNPIAFLVFSIIMIVISITQIGLLILREVSLIVLSGMIVLGAAGQYFRITRSWLGNMLGIIIPIMLWKPMAAMLVAIAMQFISSATGTLDIVIGLVFFILSVLSLKPMMKIFAVMVPGGSSSGGGGGLIAAAGTGALAMSSMGGSGGAAPPVMSTGGTNAAASAPAATGGTATAAGVGVAATAVQVTKQGVDATASEMSGPTT